MKRRLFIGTVVSLVFLVLAVRGIDWSEFTSVLGRTRFRFLLPAAVLTIVGHYFRAYRWKFMLLPVKAIRTWTLFSATLIGLMANNLLPARLGEIIRVYVIGKTADISKSASFATIVYERIVDVFALLALLWFILLRSSGPTWLKSSGLIVLVFNVVLLACLFLMQRYKETSGRWVNILARPLAAKWRDRLISIIENFTTGLSTLRDGRVILPITVTSVLVWLVPILRAYLCFAALDLELPLIAGVSVIVLVSLGSMIPSAPGYIGTTQYACVISLAIYGIGRDEALAFSVLFHATQLLPNTIAGLLCLWGEGMNFGDLTKRT
jgi:uncharacterized protein (TIRG00374 family)